MGFVRIACSGMRDSACLFSYSSMGSGPSGFVEKIGRICLGPDPIVQTRGIKPLQIQKFGGTIVGRIKNRNMWNIRYMQADVPEIV